MDKKLIVTLSVIIFYVIFCGLFIKFYDKASNRGTRFCSSNTEEYSNEVLFDAFKESNFSKIWKDHDNDDKEYLKIYRGRPLCGGLEYISTNSVLSDEHYDYSYRGIIILNKQIYDDDRYCIDKSDDFPDGWKLMVCHRDVLFHRIFHLAVIILSILLFGFIIYAHGYYKELRDFKGKTVIGLMLAEILAYLTYSWRFLSYDELDNFLRSAFLMGLLQILLWITVLTVHEFIVFKNFKQPTQNEQKFTRYAVIEIIFTILFTIFILFRRSSEAGEFFVAAFFIIYVFQAIIFIAIGIKMFILSRHMTQSDQSRFDDEKKWFWIIVKLSLITLITWPFQFLSWPIHFSLYGFITKDILVLITAISIGFILLGRKKVKSTVFGNYRLVNINKA